MQGQVSNHESFLCLNKLTRIFNYVKKIDFAPDFSEEKILDLVQLQI